MLKPRQKFTSKQVKEDKLTTTIITIRTYLETEWQKIILIATAALVLLLIIVFIYKNNKSSEATAASSLYQIEFGFIERQSYNDQLVKQLEDFLKKYKNTSIGSTGMFYLGTAYYQVGKYAQAEEQYKNYIKTGDGPSFLKSSAVSGIAASYAQRGMYKEAAEYYQKAVTEYPDEFNTPENTLGLVRMLVKNGKKDEAKKQCRTIIEKYPNTREARDAETLLAQL